MSLPILTPGEQPDELEHGTTSADTLPREPEHNPLGNRHILYDIWVAESAILERVEPLREIICHAAKLGGATVIHHHFHQFAPFGVTGFLLLAESHISVHTWSEDRYAAFDIFSCGLMNSDLIVQTIREALKPTREITREVWRGQS